MSIVTRFKRLALVILGTTVILGGLYFASFLFVAFSAIAFSGSIGNRWEAFVEQFIPLGYFLAGALTVAAMVAAINSLVASRGWWVKIIISSAIAGGSIALLSSSFADYLTALSNAIVRVIDLVFTK